MMQQARWLFWDLLTTDQQHAILAAWPECDPPHRADWETAEEIDRIMRQKPAGELALLLAGGKEA